jgi:heme oxygenase (biliverdin-IX-beta and delta-forming)
VVSVSHQSLRTATADAHARLDALYACFDLARADGYCAFLRAHAAALLPVETWLDRAGAVTVVADWCARRRAAPLRADLLALGEPVPAGRPFAAAATRPALAGALYVLEGSRLGGRYLARGVPADFPRAFLDPVERPSWPALLAAVDSALADPADHPAAIDAALAVFARFEETGRAHFDRRAA